MARFLGERPVLVEPRSASGQAGMVAACPGDTDAKRWSVGWVRQVADRCGLVHRAGRSWVLTEAARRPNVVLQVIPLAVGAHQGMSGNFVIADFAEGPPAVYQDTAARGQIVEDADDIAAVTLMWDPLKSEALARSTSVELVEEAAKAWT